jgi:hypothetical protein
LILAFEAPSLQQGVYLIDKIGFWNSAHLFIGNLPVFKEKHGWDIPYSEF